MRLHTHTHTHTRTHTEWLAGFGLQIQWTRLNSWAHDMVKDFSKSSSESSLVQASEGHLIFLCTACIRSPHTFNTPCPLFNKRRPSNQWHGNTEITCNTTGKIRMMTAVTFKGRTRRRKEDDRRRAGSTIKGITHVTTLQTVAVSSVCDANKNTNDIP